jgi:hypothetical protein
MQYGSNEFNNGTIYSDNRDINLYNINNSINNRYDASIQFQKVEEINSISNENRVDTNINHQIYRYKFTNEVTEALHIFAKVHQYDHRKVFKEAWEVWVEENEKLVLDEVKRLNELGYEGDIIDKMFKSARYYFRKKGTKKKALKERRTYIAVQKNLLDTMDKHIVSGLNRENYKPSEGFNEFCKINTELLKEQVNIFCKNGFADAKEIKEKIKKTYKNRYFLVIKQYL